MKQKIITLKINKANAGQLITLACELRIMAKSWKKFGPEIESTGWQAEGAQARSQIEFKKLVGRVGHKCSSRLTSSQA